MSKKKTIILMHNNGIVGKTNIIDSGSCFGNYDENNKFCKCDAVQELCKRETERRGGVLIISNKKRKR